MHYLPVAVQLQVRTINHKYHEQCVLRLFTATAPDSSIAAALACDIAWCHHNLYLWCGRREIASVRHVGARCAAVGILMHMLYSSRTLLLLIMCLYEEDIL